MERSFSKENTGALRAVATVIIIFTHLNRTMLAKPENPLLILGQFANLAVCLFFYYTGYNLFNNYKKRNDSWHDRFWMKKICRMYLPFLLMNIAVQILWWLQGKGPEDPITVILCAMGFYLLNPDVWYIQSCLIFYFLFYLVFRPLDLLRKDKKAGNMLIFILGIAIVLVYKIIYSRFGAYKVSLSILPLGFVLGMAVAVFGEVIYPFWKRHKWEIFFILMFAAVAIPVYLQNQIRFSSWAKEAELMTSIHQLVLLIMANTLLIGEKIESKLFGFIDKYSLNLYISHSFFYVILRSELIYIKSDLLYLAVYLLCIFGAAFLLNKLSGKAYMIAGKAMTGNKT